MNGDRATVETSLRSKTPQIHLLRTELKEITENMEDQLNSQNQGNNYQAPVDTYGGQTTYAGGQTAYDIGKTPMAINTPNYLPQTPRDNNDYGTAGGYRDREDYDPNKSYDRRDYNTRY